MQRNKLVPVLAVAGGAIVLVLVLVIAISLGGKSKSSVNTSNLQMVAAVDEMLHGIPQQGTALGNPKAPVTMVEFADPQCSGCAYFSTNVLPSLIQIYVRTGKLRIEYAGQTIIDHQTHDSVRLIRMAMAAGEQKKFWNFVELVYANQGAEDSGYATDSFLKAIAAAIPGLDAGKAFSTFQANSYATQIKASGDLFNKLKFEGTPSFQIGKSGGPLKAYRSSTIPPLSYFQKIINPLLKG
jgi:protein-disulfide isomerase